MAVRYPVTLLFLQFLTTYMISVDLGNAVLRRNFATKSAYPMYGSDEVPKVPENCTPLHINVVFRHGTRYPGSKDIVGMNNMASYVNTFFSKERPRQYGNLTLPWINLFYHNHGEKMLAKRGGEEMYGISKRLLTRFPSLFPRYYADRHYFVSTSTPRASQSAAAVAYGLFEGKGYIGNSKFQPVTIMTTNLSDPVLRFFDKCERYKRHVSKNKAISLKEFDLFKNGQEMGHVKKMIAERLNISEVTGDHVQHMFLSCAYQVAIHGNGDWCSVFEEEDLDIVEYLYDIKNYWKRGYGYEINYEMSCLLLKNLTESVHNAVKNYNNSHTLGIFHFAHAETLIPLLCILGLFKNTEPLRADNYHKQKDRQFRTANMAPFSGNLAVVLYSCKKDHEVANYPSFFVEVLANEKAIGLPCCDDKKLCPIHQFLSCFKDIDNWCDFSKICSYDVTGSESHYEL